MQKLNTLWQLVNTAAAMRDLAQHTKKYYFPVTGPLTFYLRTENAAVHISRWNRPMIEVTTILQGSFGWRIATEQDEAGVYVAAARRLLVGGLASARFEARVPRDTHLALNLTDSSLLLTNIDGKMEIPPQVQPQTVRLLPQGQET